MNKFTSIPMTGKAILLRLAAILFAFLGSILGTQAENVPFASNLWEMDQDQRLTAVLAKKD